MREITTAAALAEYIADKDASKSSRPMTEYQRERLALEREKLAVQQERQERRNAAKSANGAELLTLAVALVSTFPPFLTLLVLFFL